MRRHLSEFLSIGFRPFFWLGSLYAVYLGVIWGGSIGGHLSWQSNLPIMFWHGHEFVFGFVMAIVIGFLTTAVQNWTGLKSVNGAALGGLVVLWLLGRLAFNSGSTQILWLMAPDLLVLLATAVVVSSRVLRAKNYHNLVFLPLLLLFGWVHSVQLYYLHEQDFLALRAWEITSIWLVIFLIGLVGTRVIPFFVERRLGLSIPREQPLLTFVNQSVLFILAMASVIQLPMAAIYALLGLALIGNFHRLIRWHRPGIWQEPMLWSLWLAYLCLPITFGLLLIDFHGGYMHALHLLTVGAIAGIILAMISRVSLGHSGRAIHSSPVITLSFVLIYSAALSRGLGGMVAPQWLHIWYALSIVCWIGAFALFAARFTKVMWTPRADAA